MGPYEQNEEKSKFHMAERVKLEYHTLVKPLVTRMQEANEIMDDQPWLINLYYILRPDLIKS